MPCLEKNIRMFNISIPWILNNFWFLEKKKCRCRTPIQLSMVFLFLQQPQIGSSSTVDIKEKLSVLEKIESIISSLIKNGARYEARLWLYNTISAIHSISPSDQHEIFQGLLENKASRKDVAPQLLQMIFQKCPEKIGPIIAKRCSVLKKFFRGNDAQCVNIVEVFVFVLFYVGCFYLMWFILSPRSFSNISFFESQEITTASYNGLIISQFQVSQVTKRGPELSPSLPFQTATLAGMSWSGGAPMANHQQSLPQNPTIFRT